MLDLAPGVAQLGTESAFSVLARAGALAAEGRSIVNLGIGQPDFRTADHIVEAAVKALRDGHHGYTPAPGIPALREAVAAYLHRLYGIEVDPGRVLSVPGGKVTMWFAILMFGTPGTEILVPDPGFPIYASAVRFSGAMPVSIPLREENAFAWTADDVLSRITPQTRLIILNSPANPTGGVVTKDEIDRLVAGLERHPDVAVLSDEIYSRMTYDGREHVTLLGYPSLQDRLILLDGWSKTYAMTGWRLGFSVWPASLFDAAERLAVNSHSCVNASAQHAGIAALEGPQDAVAQMVAAFAARRRGVLDALNRLANVTCAEPGGAFYAFPNMTATGWPAEALQQRLLEDAGVATIAGTSFGAAGEGFLRLSYANTLDAIEEGVARIGAWLEAHPASDGVA